MYSIDGAQFGAEIRTSGPRKPKYLAKRGGNFYFKRKVPRDAAKAFPRARSGTLWKSLKTADEAKAKEALEAEVRRFEQRCKTVMDNMSASDISIGRARRRNGGTDKYLLPEHIPVILDAHRAETLLRDDRERERIGRDVDTSTEQKLRILCDRRAHLEKTLDALRQAAMMEQVECVDSEASSLLDQHGLIAAPRTHVRRQFLGALLRLKIEVLEEQVARLRGKKTATPSSDVAGKRARSLLTMRDAHSKWKVGQRRAKTVDAYGACVAEFEAHVGAVPLVGLTQKHGEAFRDWLLAQNRLARSTANNRFKGLATIFDHARRNAGLLELVNPFRELSVEGFRRGLGCDARRTFITTELQTIFSSKLYSGGYAALEQEDLPLYWGLPIGLFAGPRLEELAQLRSTDVHTVEGSWVFDFREAHSDQHFKNVSSLRLVPVHSELARMGFIDYVRERQQDKVNPMLFASLTNKNKYRSWSAALSKRIGRFLDTIGLSDPRVDYYSLRYVFRQQCANCGVDYQAAESLLGHWQEGGKSGVYLSTPMGTKYPLPGLLRAMQSVKYSELDLSHIQAG